MVNMLNAPFSRVNTIHFIGIGGIGMSGLAEIFYNLGYSVQGSDMNISSATVKHLIECQIKVFEGHHVDNLINADIVVISSAIKDQNPEYQHAMQLALPIYKRSDLLAELMRFKWSIAVSGTHGKTTTTSLISHLLYFAGYDPTAIIGGIVNSWNKNSILGKSNWLVAEVDESDGSFQDLPPTISVVTNVEAEHMNYYHSFDVLKKAFISFINKTPLDGFAVLCVDNKGIQDILSLVRNRRIITYGFLPHADYRILNLYYNSVYAKFDIAYTEANSFKEHIYKDFVVMMHGDHNILNVTAAIVIALNVGIDCDLIKRALPEFNGVKRRFTKIGYINSTSFIEDYAHHPTEILAVLDSARHIVGSNGKILSILQPHKYTRLQEHFLDFATCLYASDHVIVTDVYAAGDIFNLEYNAHSLVKALIEHGHKSVHYAEKNSIYAHLKEFMQHNEIDMVLFIGAGDINVIAYDCYNKLSLTY